MNRFRILLARLYFTARFFLFGAAPTIGTAWRVAGQFVDVFTVPEGVARSYSRNRLPA